MIIMSKWTCVRTDELQHHGIKGMKWGKRRFQNADGTLTPLGRFRYGKATTEDYTELHGKVEKASGFVKSAQKYQSEKDHKEYEEKIKTDLKNMTDEELRQVVNRLNMEERYTQVMRSREKELGESAAMKWLNAAGTVTTVAASAISMAVAIKQLTSKSSKSDSALLDSLGDLLEEIERGK